MSIRAHRPAVAWLAALACAGQLAASGWSVQSTLSAQPLTATVDEQGELCVRSPGRSDCTALPRATMMQSVEPVGRGWVATGRTLLDGDVHLSLLAGGPDGVRLLPPLPRTPADQRGNPVLLVEGLELRGVAWLQGRDSQALGVWAAAWNGESWGAPEAVSPTTGRPQLALSGTVLPDGRWLLLWAGDDGNDDEITFSVRDGGRWSPPRRVLADNQVFDLMPSVTVTPAGAVASWARFDGRDYRAVVAAYDGSRWTEVAQLPGRGVERTSFTHLGGGLQLLYSSVVPESWAVVELDARGRALGRVEVPAALDERPFVETSPGGPFSLRWPDRDAPPPRRIDTAPTEVPDGGTFRYMAFGDSITEGVRCEGNGYPERLPDAEFLNCPGNGCQVVNKGLGGETTSSGLTRIQSLLDNQGPWDVVLLMEGTNDICFGSISNNGIQSNLNQMETQARIRGVDLLHMTIIDLNRRGVFSGTGAFPCPADLGREDNTDTNEMEVRVRDNLANLDADTGYRWWANTRSDVSDPPEVTSEQYLCNDNNTNVPGPSNSCLDTYYANGGSDWGHPGCNGYARLTDEIRDGIVAKPVPSPVTLTAPTGTVFTSVPIFQWNKESPRDATWYELDVDGPGGSVYDAWTIETSGCSAAAGTCTRSVGSLADGSYTWRVRGRNPHGRSTWTQTSFTVLTPPSAPSPVAPTGSIGEPRPVFQWNKETPFKSDSYRLEVSDDQGHVLSDTSWDAGASCSGSSCSAEPFATGVLLTDGSYAWRVRGVNAAGEGTWSAQTAFSITGTSGIFSDGFESGDTSRWTQTVE
ncbi:MAG: GDSL-type esterase/lipase family protein [Thermoanaerobaculia bacterium]